jgi:hypothetical protein
LKPVVAVQLWLAVPVYVMYAAVWVALAVLAVAIAAVIAIAWGIVALVRFRSDRRRPEPD